MSTLERVMDLKKKGIPESEIITQLKNEGISPMEINDAMNQSKIKEAVNGEEESSTRGMMPSMMGDEEEEEQKGEQDVYSPSQTPPPYNPQAPVPSNNESDYSNYSAQENQNNSYSYPEDSESNADEEYYEEPQGGYSSGYSSMSSDTMIEVSEQVFSEKAKKIEEDLKQLKEFKTVYEPLMKDLDERLRRIEKNFDKMQIAILEKVGSFGKNIDSIKKEVEMVEDSFEKMNKNKK